MEQVEKMSTSQLIAEQHEHPVSPIFPKSASESEVLWNLTCYFRKNGVLI